MAIIFAAFSMPFNPMLRPPVATACQEWAGTPGTQVAVPNPAVGTTQVISPTSVDAGKNPPTLKG